MKYYSPYAYQQYCRDAIINNPCVGLFVDMGLGKTAITLDAINELKYFRWSVRRVLIIAPKKVAEDTWQTESQKWQQFSHLKIVSVMGTATQRQRALAEPADIYIINRDNTQWLVEFFGHKWPFDMVVLDESSSFKNPQAKRFKALKAVRPKIKRLVELTGTPNPHGLMDLWAQVYLLDGGARLGKTISVYRDMYFVPDKRNRTTIFSYAPKDGAEEAIHAAISDICISMKAKDYLELPEIVYEDIPVMLDEKAQKAYRTLEREAVLEVDADTITAANAAALSGKLLQLCSGAVYDDMHNTVPVHECKLASLVETVEQLNGQHAIICYYFIHDKERILAELKSAFKSLNIRVYSDANDKADWNAGKIDLLLMHPASCSYGLNLQEGGHHIIWYSPTWNLEEYLQMNKRLHRNGQQFPVIVHHLIVKGGRDEDVFQALAERDGIQERLLESLKVRIEKAKQGAA